MKKSFLIVFALALLGVSIYFLKFQHATKNRNPSSLNKESKSILNRMPKALQNKLSEYAHMVGLEVYDDDDYGAENSGIIAYNQRLLSKNKCFSNLTSSFYTHLAKKLLEIESRRPVVEGSYVEFTSLASKTKNSSVTSGWLWDFALKETGGDPNLAMSLIGICGHDNTRQLGEGEEVCEQLQGGSTSCITKDYAIIANENLSEYEDSIAKQKSIFSKKWQPLSNRDKFFKEILLQRLDQDKYVGILQCPIHLSSFFMQGALGEKTILPNSLVDEIASIQAPTLGVKALPSKYYHTIGAALMTCSLVREGIPGFLIKKIQKTLINTYRWQVLCELVEDNKQFNLANELSEISADQILARVKEYRKNSSVCVEEIEGSNNESQDSIDDEQDFKDDDPICNFLEGYQFLLNDPNVDEQIFKEKFNRRLAETDAAKILESSKLAASCGSIQKNNDNIKALEKLSKNSTDCFELKETSCKAAKDVLQTWWIDFKWSETQHIRGAEFAISNCVKDANYLEFNLEKKSCEILASRSSSTSQQMLEQNTNQEGVE